MKALLWQACVSGLLIGGVYALVALGLTLVFGVLRIINFAHGALMMLGMYATFFLYTHAGVDPYLSIVVVGPVFFLVGVLLERVVIEPNLGRRNRTNSCSPSASPSSSRTRRSPSSVPTTGASGSRTPRRHSSWARSS